MGISKIEQEEELNRYKHAAVPVQGRRKGAGTRTWLVVSASGKSHVEEVGKHLIMKRTGLPARDLRILDPLLSYPSTILGREKAIVVNLEHIKAIITATEVLILNSIVPLVAPFVQDLQERVTNFNEAPINPSESSDTDADAIKRPVWMSPSSEGDILPIDPPIREDSQHLDVSMIESTLSLERNHGSPVSQQDDQKKGGPQVLPFEFKALEVCLESACRCLESETSKLEQEAYPALDELTSKISTLNLERVRQIKSRLVALSGRVQKVRDELEHLLDDDMDMAEMYLTNKLSSQQLGGISSLEEDNQAYYMDDERDDDLRSQTKSSSENGNNFKPDIEELEMLLEAYFVQVEGTLNKLSTMRDYVDDTEDYINIMLDDKQNQLLQMGVVLSTATLVSSAGIVVVGLFGMNINISLFDGEPVKFWETTLGTLGGCLILYFLAIGWGKTRGLLS